MKETDLLVFGYGAMTGAMVQGWLASGYDPGAITLYNPRPKPAPPGVSLTSDIPTTAPGVLVLGFKPALLESVAPTVQHLAGPGTLVCSVLAGATLATLRSAFPDARGVIRFMPNLAAALGASVTALASDELAPADRALVTDLAARIGHAEWLDGEGDFEAVTALAGCGPAYVYRFIDALAGAASDLGLDPERAARLALAMTAGSAQLAAHAGVPAAELARRVASPGGMTQRGLDVLDRDAALSRLLAETLRAARDRGREMGAAAPKDGQG